MIHQLFQIDRFIDPDPLGAAFPEQTFPNRTIQPASLAFVVHVD